MTRSPLLPFLGGPPQPEREGPSPAISGRGVALLMERLAEQAAEGTVRHVARGVAFSTTRGSRHVQVVQRTRDGEIVRISVLTVDQLRKVLAAAQATLDEAAADAAG